MTEFCKTSEISTRLTEDHNPQWVYFIDGVYFQQKGFKTEEEANVAGQNKLKELLTSKK